MLGYKRKVRREDDMKVFTQAAGRVAIKGWGGYWQGGSGGLQFGRAKFDRPIRPPKGAVQEAAGSVCLEPRGKFWAAGVLADGVFKDLKLDELLEGVNVQRSSQGPEPQGSPTSSL